MTDRAAGADDVTDLLAAWSRDDHAALDRSPDPLTSYSRFSPLTFAFSIPLPLARVVCGIDVRQRKRTKALDLNRGRRRRHREMAHVGRQQRVAPSR